MNNAFRKRGAIINHRDLGSAQIANIEVITSKEVEVDGTPTTIVERKVKNIHDYAESLGLPKSEEYKLETMLRAGHVPEEVPCSGLLDNSDPTALENQVNVMDMFDELKSLEPAPAAPVNEPSNAD